jgi:hypothetical protein
MKANSFSTLFLTALAVFGMVFWFYLSQKDKEQAWNKKIQNARIELEKSQILEKERIGKIEKSPNQLSSKTSENKPELQSDLLQVSTPSDPFLNKVYDLVDKSAEIYKNFQKNPGSTIPELSLLTEANWIELGEKADLSNPQRIQIELAKTRNMAKSLMMESLMRAVWTYLDDHPGTTPNNFSELKPYIKAPINDAMLARYEISRAEGANSSQQSSNKDNPTKIIISERAPINKDLEKPAGLWVKGKTGSLEGGLKAKAYLPP